MLEICSGEFARKLLVLDSFGVDLVFGELGEIDGVKGSFGGGRMIMMGMPILGRFSFI